VSALASGETSPPQLRPLALGEVLDVGMKIVWRNAATLIRAVVFVVLPIEIVSAFVQLSSVPSGATVSGGSLFTPSYDAPPDQLGLTHAQRVTIVLGSGTSVLLGAIAGILAAGACYRAIASAYLGEQTGWRDSLGFALRRLHSILWITIAAGLVSLLGLLLCIIPGVYLAVGFSVAVPVLMTEGLRGFGALGRSRSLVKGFWWRTLGVLALGGILTALISGTLSGILIAFISSGSSPTAWVIGNVATSTIARVLTTPLTAAFITILYFDLRVRKEAFDLQLLASRIGVEPPPGWAPPMSEPSTAGAQPPFWPPPPGWAPPEPAPDAPAPRDPPGPGQPPYWPPPPGWKPGETES
jgi:hypothetical protein